RSASAQSRGGLSQPLLSRPVKLFGYLFTCVSMGAVSYMFWRSRQRTRERLEQREKLARLALSLANSSQMANRLYSLPLHSRLSDEAESLSNIGLNFDRLSNRDTDWNPASAVEFHRILVADKCNQCGCLFVYGKRLQDDGGDAGWQVVRLEACVPPQSELGQELHEQADSKSWTADLWQTLNRPTQSSGRQIVRLFDDPSAESDYGPSLGLKDPLCRCTV
ncbi:hypothetical protein BOX15_Mlig016356g5, partial [Macrostomum lignano]